MLEERSYSWTNEGNYFVNTFQRSKQTTKRSKNVLSLLAAKSLIILQQVNQKLQQLNVFVVIQLRWSVQSGLSQPILKGVYSPDVRAHQLIQLFLQISRTAIPAYHYDLCKFFLDSGVYTKSQYHVRDEHMWAMST